MDSFIVPIFCQSKITKFGLTKQLKQEAGVSFRAKSVRKKADNGLEGAKFVENWLANLVE